MVATLIVVLWGICFLIASYWDHKNELKALTKTETQSLEDEMISYLLPEDREWLESKSLAALDTVEQVRYALASQAEDSATEAPRPAVEDDAVSCDRFDCVNHYDLVSFEKDFPVYRIHDLKSGQKYKESIRNHNRFKCNCVKCTEYVLNQRGA